MNLAVQKTDDSEQMNNQEDDDSRGNIFTRRTKKNKPRQEEQKAEDQKLEMFDESTLPYYERSTYGELVLGGSDDVTMEMELDYYYLKK
jgi:hypothetical protein